MSIYIFEKEKVEITPIPPTTFVKLDIQETNDLQPRLKSRIEAISPETLIIAEEFSEWEDSNRSIDLLGVDKQANLVVIELKRTTDGGHMELQAVRYAAMISTFTFENATSTYEAFLRENKIELDARENLREHLGWDDANAPDDKPFGQEVKIVLASNGFSNELMTSVMWLNEFGIDIRCVKLQPHEHDGQVLIDVQTIFPIPEAADYQVRIREKKQRERESRQSTRQLRYDLEIAGRKFQKHHKRNMMCHLVEEIFKNKQQATVPIVQKVLASKLRKFEGNLDYREVRRRFDDEDQGGRIPRRDRFFCKEGEPFSIGDSTYVLSNQWGRSDTNADTMRQANTLDEEFPDLKISFHESSSSTT